MPHQCFICKKCLHEAPGDLPTPTKRCRKHKFQMSPAPPPKPVLACLPCGCGEIMHKLCLINHFNNGNQQCPQCQVVYKLRQIRDAKIVDDPECQYCNELKATIEAEEKRKKDLQDKIKAMELENRALEASTLKMQGASEMLEKNMPWYKRPLYKIP